MLGGLGGYVVLQRASTVLRRPADVGAPRRGGGDPGTRRRRPRPNGPAPAPAPPSAEELLVLLAILALEADEVA